MAFMSGHGGMANRSSWPPLNIQAANKENGSSGVLGRHSTGHTKTEVVPGGGGLGEMTIRLPDLFYSLWPAATRNRPNNFDVEIARGANHHCPY